MANEAARGPATRLIGLGVIVAAGIGGLEWLRSHGQASATLPLVQAIVHPVVAAYDGLRTDVLAHRWRLGGLGFLLIVGGMAAFRLLSRTCSRWRERLSGMGFSQHSYGLRNPFARAGEGAVAAAQEAFVEALWANEAPDTRVVLGVDEKRRPVYLTDRARSMHVQLIGQTGSGKTQSVIYPLLFQDVWRRRGVVLLDAKGSAENEQAIVRMAAASGRIEELRVFTLNPRARTHTYNPLHLRAQGDPQAMAERVFSTLAEAMDNPYYRDMARELFVNLVRALAATGKRMCMWDVAACVADEEVLCHALSLSDDRVAVARIKNRLARLGDKYDMTYSGLLAAVGQYDHPAVNAYRPDIVLEDIVERGHLVAFSLNANAYKFLARSVGVLVLQHLQEVGAARQMDRRQPQQPVYVYADEFYTFAYEGFIDSVNKLRDAGMSMLLSHQSLADLERVSAQYARGVWDNTRTKIILYQSDPDLCQRLAASVGTRKAVELTVRRSVDAWLNQTSMLEASSKQVDEFVLHPSVFKNLAVGQACLVQLGLAEPVRHGWWRRAGHSTSSVAMGVHLALLKELPDGVLRFPEVAEADDGGLRLYERFVSAQLGKGA
jgi:hypothetical protein